MKSGVCWVSVATMRWQGGEVDVDFDGAALRHFGGAVVYGAFAASALGMEVAAVPKGLWKEDPMEAIFEGGEGDGAVGVERVLAVVPVENTRYAVRARCCVCQSPVQVARRGPLCSILGMRSSVMRTTTAMTTPTAQERASALAQGQR